jgi:hypothetical protein
MFECWRRADHRRLVAATRSKNRKDEMMTPEEMQEAINRAAADPVCCFLNEISAADTQLEALNILKESRELLRSLSGERRKYVLKQVNEMVDEKPVTFD